MATVNVFELVQAATVTVAGALTFVFVFDIATTAPPGGAGRSAHLPSEMPHPPTIVVGVRYIWLECRRHDHQVCVWVTSP